jgi:hypothetical protein
LQSIFWNSICSDVIERFINRTSKVYRQSQKALKLQQGVGWNATPEHTRTLKTYDFPTQLRNFLKKEQIRDLLLIDVGK